MFNLFCVFVQLCPGLAIRIVSFARLHDLSFPLQSGGPALSLKTHFIFPSLYLFLSQVRYLLQGGAKCRTLCCRFLWGALIWSTIICQGAFWITRLRDRDRHLGWLNLPLGPNSVCHPVPNDEEASNGCLHMGDTACSFISNSSISSWPRPPLVMVQISSDFLPGG